MNRLSFLTDFAEDNRHYDSDKEIHAVLDDPQSSTYSIMNALAHPNLTPDHITKALNNTNALVRGEAIRHPNVTPDHITKALSDVNSGVVLGGIQNPKISDAQLRHALYSGTSVVGAIAYRLAKQRGIA